MIQPRGSSGTAWRRGVAAALLLASLAACGRRRAGVPDWVATAPAGTVLAVSGQAGWLLEQPGFQAFLERFPRAGQSLELFLKGARINPHLETGRISLFVLSLGGRPETPAAPPAFLIQLGGFKDQAAVHLALLEAFPPEGSLPVNRSDLPVYVIMDINQYHIRAVADAQGRIWLGELKTLAGLGSGTFPPRHPVLEAQAWINRSAPFQGFLLPRAILNDLSGKLPVAWARNLPEGIEALAWSVTPGGSGKEALHRFELGIAGSPEGVLQVAPWIQRFVAAASVAQGTAPGQAPEILQERRRIGLRCQLNGEQINQALARLSQPGLSLRAKP